MQVNPSNIAKYLFIILANYLLLAKAVDSDILKIMTNNEITPQIVPEEPSSKLTLQYGDVFVDLGQELTPTQVKDQPKVNWTHEPNNYYTLIMFDPDAPSKENATFANVKHWFIGNILDNDVNNGEVIAEYIGSGPPKGTGLHRYIFLVYPQREKLDFGQEPKSEYLSRQNRFKWSLKDFVKKYDLARPVAGNFFKAQWDPYVDERNAQIKN